MEGFGREFNVLHLAKGVWIPLVDCGGVAWSNYLAGAVGDTYTLQEAKDKTGTGAQNLVAITRYWTSNGVGGVWTLQTQTAAATVITTNTTAQNGMLVEIDAQSLDDGYSYVKLTSTGAGNSCAILRDLHRGRKPSNLPALV